MRRCLLLTLMLLGALVSPATAAMSVSAPSVTEGGTLTFTVTRATATEVGTASTADGTAAAGSDYTARADVPLVFTGMTATVDVQTTADAGPELDETVLLNVSGTSDASGTGTIVDDDPPEVSLADAAVLESARYVDVPLTLTPVSREVQLTFRPHAGTAAPNADYEESLSSAAYGMTVPAGASRAAVRIPILDDTADEDPETFTVAIAPVAGTAKVVRGTATVTIASDNDVRSITIADTQVVEGDGPGTIVRVPVVLNAPTFRVVAAQFATVDLTARAPGDYLSRLGTVTFQPGQTQAFIDIAIRSDDAIERAEQFAVLVGRQVGAGIAKGTAVVTIADDDALAGDDVPPNVRVSAPARSGRAVTVRVSCPRNEQRCRGRLTLYTQPDRRSSARSLRRERRLGRARFSLAGGQARTLRLALARSVAAAARRAGRLKVRAFVVTTDLSDNTDTTVASATLRFRR